MEIKTIRWKIVGPILLVLISAVSLSIWFQQGNTTDDRNSNPSPVNTSGSLTPVPGGGGNAESLPLKDNVQYIIRDGNGRIKENKTAGK